MPQISVEERSIRKNLTGNETKDDIATQLLLHCIEKKINIVYLGYVYKHSDSPDSMITNFFESKGLAKSFPQEEEIPKPKPEEKSVPRPSEQETEVNQYVDLFTEYKEPTQRPQTEFNTNSTPEKIYLQSFFLNSLFDFQIPHFTFDFQNNFKIMKNNLFNFWFNLFETMDNDPQKFDVDVDVEVEAQNEKINVELKKME
jgi:hypothetical protein